MNHVEKLTCPHFTCICLDIAFEHQYEEVDYFQLSNEDMDLVGTNEQLKNALVERDRLEITGDLGEGIALAACAYYSIKYELTVTSSIGAFGRVFKGVFKTNQDEEEPEFTPVAIKTIKSEGDYSVHVRTMWLGMKYNC